MGMKSVDCRQQALAVVRRNPGGCLEEYRWWSGGIPTVVQMNLDANELSSEVNSLKKTLAKKIDNLESASLRSPCGKPSIRLEDSNECLPMKNNLDTPSGQNPIQSENAAITLHEIDNENRLVFHDEPMIVSLQPDCCRRTKGNYGTGTDRSYNPCAFHTLVELLVGMKIYVECQTEGPCFLVIHQMSGKI
ncbi:uncharacterized protein LOC110094633 [Dendrobium catenatum]|uniref:uncharacterized protein LOC110094633 n=1 Tax=Dendrobium catenatum TaxID=906689 RepID=UPI0009F2CDD6|nr:uncharacterized protein LOC110094633 [Dendrobium catenatum]